MSDTEINNFGYKAISSNDYHLLSESDKKKGVVLNLDNKGSGTHWTAIKKTGPNQYSYYDSYGVRPSYSVVKNSLIKYNTKVDQKPHEENCGKRSILFLNNKQNA